MKILELTDFSAGACGVWIRAKQEAELLSKRGHKVKVFSSNIIKGTNKITKSKEKIEDIEIQRFNAIMPGKKPLDFLPGGESFMFWNSRKTMDEAKKFKPDVIIAHSYSHPHTLFALKAGKRIGAKVFLVTHSPFVEGGKTRSIWGSLARGFFDKTFGRRTINKFDKVITITKWEEPHLEKIGLKKEKIAYIPNGIPKRFFTKKPTKKEESKILFLGRIAPIKDLETLVNAIHLMKNKKIKCELVGPTEEEYLKKLRNLVHSLKLENRVEFTGPVYDLEKKIDKIDSAKVFVLPSIREGMPQALIEVMSRGKIVVASKNPGSAEIVTNNENGFIFKIGDEKGLARILDTVFTKKSQNLSKIRKSAKETVDVFAWHKIIKRLEKVIST